IVRAAEERGLALHPISGFHAMPAEGVMANVGDAHVAVGGPHLLTSHGGTALAETLAWTATGATVLHVMEGHTVVGALALADEVRAESRAAIDALHERGVTVVMITGDAEEVAASVATDLGIDRVFAGVRPEHKAAKVAELQAEGRTVAMV